MKTVNLAVRAISFNFLYDFTLFVIDMHHIMLISLFQPHLTTFTFMGFWNPNEWLYWNAVISWQVEPRGSWWCAGALGKFFVNAFKQRVWRRFWPNSQPLSILIFERWPKDVLNPLKMWWFRVRYILRGCPHITSAAGGGGGGKGSHPLPKSMNFYTLCKRPLTPPPSVLHDHVAIFSTWMLKSA